MERISGPRTGSTFGKTPQAESSGTACRPIAEARKFLQLVEGEHSFLGAVVVELLVLELEVFELGTEHQTGREAGTYRPFRLRSTLVFDDSLRRVAYGSQACYKPWRPEAPCGEILLWAFPHIHVRSGYILGKTTFASLVTRLLKRSLALKNFGQKQPASLRPKGSLSLTQSSDEIFPHNIGHIFRYYFNPKIISLRHFFLIFVMICFSMVFQFRPCCVGCF